MATRSARDNKALNARHAEILKAMLRKPENKLCADCKRNDPRWASTNLGCFMCIRCSGIHRSMGVHITRIKSIDLDTWTPEQVACVQRWGNKRANAYWEAHLRPGHMPPDHKIESFIRSKYESKRWAMEGPIPEPETLDDQSEESHPVAAPVSNQVPPSSSSGMTKMNSSSGINKSVASISTTNANDLFDSAGAIFTSDSKPEVNQTMATKDLINKNNNQAAGGSLFDLDFSSQATSAAVTATAPAARKDVKNDILSLFNSAKPQTYANPLAQQPGQVNMMNNQFNGLNLGAPTNAIPRANNLNISNALGDNFTNVWASPSDQQQQQQHQHNHQDPFGSFTSAPKTNTNHTTQDVFSDIWR